MSPLPHLFDLVAESKRITEESRRERFCCKAVQYEIKLELAALEQALAEMQRQHARLHAVSDKPR